MIYYILNLSYIKNIFSKIIIFKNCEIWYLRVFEVLIRCFDWLVFFGDDVGLIVWCCFFIGCLVVVGGVWAIVGGLVLVRNGIKVC